MMMGSAVTKARSRRSISSRRGGQRGLDELETFRAFCSALRLESGDPLVLEEFQSRMLAEYFAGVRETLICVPKKNGKTSILGALALFHLLSTPDAECVIAAASRDQATILYDQASGFVRRSPGLDERVAVKRGYREMRAVTAGGRIRVLAADADTADGVLPTLALVDELHRHKSGDLYGVFLDGLGPRRGQLITISTAGDDLESPLGRLRAKAMTLPDVRHVRSEDESYTRAASRDGGFVMHEWALDADADREDVRVAKRANPASWQTVEELRRRHESPSMTPWQWARFACGVWVQGEDAAISPVDWGRCGDPGLVIGDGEAVWVGLDLGWKWDTTAIVPVAAGGDGVRVGVPAIVEPPRDGTSTAEEDIIGPLLEMRARWKVLGVVFDRNAGGQQLAQRLERDHGMTVVDYSQDPAPMAAAAERLAEAVRSGGLTHPADERLTAHVLAAVAKRTTGEKWRLVKRRKPVDAAIALAMAVSVAAGVLERPAPAFERLA